jgi:hypothetical protein
MRSNDPKPLDRDLRDALEIERAAVFAPDEAKARVLGRVARTVGGLFEPGAAGGEHETPGSAPPATGLRAGARLAKPLSLVASFALGSVAGIFFWRGTHPPVPAPIAPAERDPPAMVSSPPPREATVVATAPSAAPVAQATPSSNGSPASSLAAERTLLDIARSAFGRGEGGQALAALARHEKLYPNGQLAEEREALAVRSLVLTQRIDQARSRAARFRRRYPDSVMLPAVEAALETSGSLGGGDGTSP